MLKKLFIAVCVVSIFAIACGKVASEEDVKKSIDGITSAYEGYYKVLEDNKDDPNKAIEEGKKYIESKRADLEKCGETLAFVKEEQMNIVEDGMKKIKDISLESGKKLGANFGTNREALEKLQEQVMELGNIYVKAQEKAVGGGVMSGMQDAAKKKALETAKSMILKQADQYKAIPEAAREQTLDGLVKGLKAQGATDEEIEAFKKEFKEKAGW